MENLHPDTLRRLVAFLNRKGVTATAADEAELSAILSGFASLEEQNAFRQRAAKFTVHKLLLEDVRDVGGVFDPPTKSLAKFLETSNYQRDAVETAERLAAYWSFPVIVADGNQKVLYVADEPAGQKYNVYMSPSACPMPVEVHDAKPYQLVEPGCPSLRQAAGCINGMATAYRRKPHYSGCPVFAVRESDGKVVFGVSV